MAKKAKRKLTASQKSSIITQDLTDLLVKWNDDGVVIIKETAQIAALVPLVTGAIQMGLLFRR